MTASTKPDLDRPLRIGTRASELALWQAHHIRDRLRAAWGDGLSSSSSTSPPRATGSRTGRSTRSAARACSSTPSRSSSPPAPSTSPSTA
ncbi:hypothetical protein [Nannocystis pusilla]|uniref:hypothetical protein n=1 Tax=Nannocystis pusilla TaxID=889268 RepID=UPI003B80653F